ncbi:MAG: WXG100 family type VII secretion target [Oscillospiraceae bacterium]|nr:WXG100 family type VII secretion target [Oscillospiraceae bacterium]MBR1898773.1 WXG100 family type VII secretion target [Oscillospiraceae bacterium]
MARNANDTDIMRGTADEFWRNSNNFLTEHKSMQESLTAITEALREFQENFKFHNEHVDEFRTKLDGSANSLGSVWEGMAAGAFQTRFTELNKTMMDLSTVLEDISDKGNELSKEIETVVSQLQGKVDGMSAICDTISKNFKTYADTEDENERDLAKAFGV